MSDSCTLCREQEQGCTESANECINDTCTGDGCAGPDAPQFRRCNTGDTGYYLDANGQALGTRLPPVSPLVVVSSHSRAAAVASQIAQRPGPRPLSKRQLPEVGTPGDQTRWY